MKTYRYIVINKDNMKDLKHFPTSSKVVDYMFNKLITRHIIIEDESKVINISSIDEVEDHLVKISRLRSLLNE